MKRSAISNEMKWRCLMYRGFFTCPICGEPIKEQAKIEWDHVHELSDGGEHEYWNLRPLHEACHQKKTTVACKQRAHINRLAKGKKPSKHPMKSAPREWPIRKFGAWR